MRFSCHRRLGFLTNYMKASSSQLLRPAGNRRAFDWLCLGEIEDNEGWSARRRNLITPVLVEKSFGGGCSIDLDFNKGCYLSASGMSVRSVAMRPSIE